MSQKLGAMEQLILTGVAFLNGVVFYPMMKKTYNNFTSVRAKPTHFAFFDISINGRDEGRIDLELFGEEAPKTVNNFLGLATGGFKKGLTYTESRFHRAYHGYMVQGGDLYRGDGQGEDSVYGGAWDAEENDLKFKEPYLIAMAKRRDGKVGSQFFITTEKNPFMKDEGVIFGRVTKNTELVERISQSGDENGDPQEAITIKQSGVYSFPKALPTTAAHLPDFDPDFRQKE